jgi:K+-sensing histidine kinase KdpD
VPGASTALALLVEASETLTAAADPFEVLDSLAARASAYLGARCTISVTADDTTISAESLAFPIRASGRLLGRLTIANPDHNRRYTVDDIHFAVVLADRVAVALENQRLRRELQFGGPHVPPSS